MAMHSTVCTPPSKGTGTDPMETFAYRDGGFSSSMSRGEALLLRQLAEVLVVTRRGARPSSH